MVHACVCREGNFQPRFTVSSQFIGHFGFVQIPADALGSLFSLFCYAPGLLLWKESLVSRHNGSRVHLSCSRSAAAVLQETRCSSGGLPNGLSQVMATARSPHRALLCCSPARTLRPLCNCLGGRLVPAGLCRGWPSEQFFLRAAAVLTLPAPVSQSRPEAFLLRVLPGRAA